MPKPSTPKDAEALVEYNKYFTEKELEKLDIPYVQRIENNTERDVIRRSNRLLKEFGASPYNIRGKWNRENETCN